MTHLAAVFRMWSRLCGLNVGGLGATRVRCRCTAVGNRFGGLFSMRVDACSFPCSPFQSGARKMYE